MQRVCSIVGLVVLTATICLVLLNIVRNPMDSRRAAQESRVSSVIMPAPPNFDNREDFSASLLAIQSKPKLWSALVPAPPAQMKAPDMAGLLKGVQPTRGQIGKGEGLKVKIKTPHSKRGEWMKKGDIVNGLTIKSVTKDEVIFSVTVGGREYTHPLKRK